MKHELHRYDRIEDRQITRSEVDALALSSRSRGSFEGSPMKPALPSGSSFSPLVPCSGRAAE
jgi:hypothetical protein